MIVDDQEAYSTGLVSAMVPIFQAAGITVDHESVQQTTTDFSSLVAKVTPTMTVVVLPWQIAANAQQFGRNLAQQHKNAVIFGTDGLFSPGTFTISGSYVSSFGPDITAIPADAAIARAALQKYGSFGTFGPPTFAATHVVDEAIASVCKAGQTPSHSNVLAAIKNTNESTSILGQRISFTSNGDLVNGKFFLFKITSTGKYQLIPAVDRLRSSWLPGDAGHERRAAGQHDDGQDARGAFFFAGAGERHHHWRALRAGGAELHHGLRGAQVAQLRADTGRWCVIFQLGPPLTACVVATDMKSPVVVPPVT